MVEEFFIEWLFVVVVLLAAALCGAGVLTPFIKRVPFALLAAPLAGLLLVPWFANAFYSLLTLSYPISALISAGAWLALSLVQFRTIYRDKSFPWLLLAVPIIAAIAIPAMDM